MDKSNSSTASLKTQAKLLRAYLAERGVELTHSHALEAVARSRGFKDWNTASAFLFGETHQGAKNWRESTSPRWEDVMLEDPEADWALLTLPAEVAYYEMAGVVRRENGEWAPRNYEAALLLALSTRTEYPDGSVGQKFPTGRQKEGRPYRVVEESPEDVTVVWEATVSSNPGEEHERELGVLAADGRRLVFDFTATRALGSRWLRLLHRLSLRRDDLGERLLIAGMRESLLEVADKLAIRENLHLVEPDPVPESPT